MKFHQPVELMGITLKGNYLIVHDDEAMARGESCTYVYGGLAEDRENLVVSFHCSAKKRAKASHFTVRSRRGSSGYDELTEFQFSGSTEGHLVPLSMNQ